MRRVAADVDPDTWPAFDARAVAKPLRGTFDARKHAIELYAASTPLAEILERTGVHRRQLYRLIDHCLAQHEDGRHFGWRGLVPYVRVANYQRVARIDPRVDGTGAGAAGAFSNLLRAYPALATWIADRVRDKRVALQQISTDKGLRTRLAGLKHLHNDFLSQCRAVGLSAQDYPFNTEQLGVRSLSAAVRAECLRSFGRGARLALAAMPIPCVSFAVFRRIASILWSMQAAALGVKLSRWRRSSARPFTPSIRTSHSWTSSCGVPNGRPLPRSLTRTAWTWRRYQRLSRRSICFGRKARPTTSVSPTR